MIEDCANHCCVIKSIFFHPNSSTPDWAQKEWWKCNKNFITRLALTDKQTSEFEAIVQFFNKNVTPLSKVGRLWCYDDSSFCMYQKWWLLLDDRFSSSCTLQDLTFLLGFYVSQIVKRWWVQKLWQWIILLKSSKVDQFLPKLNIDFN